MNMTLFIILIFALQIICLMVGKLSAKKLDTQDDYFLAGRSVSFFPLMMTFVATQVGGGTILGAAEEAYRYGWSVLFYPLGQALGLIVLGLGVGRRLALFGVPTVAQIFDVAYRSPLLRRIASLLSITSLFLILVAVILASKKFMASLGFNSLPLFLCFWGILIFYTVRGGLKAVIATDVIQAAFFIVVFLGALFFSSSETVANLRFDDSVWDLSKISRWLLMPLFFMMIEQDMAQRCLAGGSLKTVSKASFWAGFVMILVCFVPVVLGVAARSLDLTIPDGGSVLMTYVAAVTNPWVTAIVGCAVLAAILSTADSLINAISSNLMSDFELFQKKSSMNTMQIVTIAISILALLASLYATNIVSLVITSYELSVDCLFVPIVYALFKRKGHCASAAVSFGAGAAGYWLCPQFALLISAAAFSIVELTLSRREAQMAKESL